MSVEQFMVEYTKAYEAYLNHLDMHSDSRPCDLCPIFMGSLERVIARTPDAVLERGGLA